MAGMLNGAKAYQAQQRLDMNRLVESYAPLVKRIALHLKARLPACVEVDDLIQSGMIGLMRMGMELCLKHMLPSEFVAL